MDKIAALRIKSALEPAIVLNLVGVRATLDAPLQPRKPATMTNRLIHWDPIAAPGKPNALVFAPALIGAGAKVCLDAIPCFFSDQPLLATQQYILP